MLVGLGYVVVGAALAAVFYRLFERVSDDPTSPSPTEDKWIRLEYETLNDEIERRGELLAIHGSIFVAASILLVGVAFGAKELAERAGISFLALLIFAVFLFTMNYTTRKLDALAYQRLRGIEAGRFEAHEYVRSRTEGKAWAKWRRRTWFAMFIVIIIAGWAAILFGG